MIVTNLLTRRKILFFIFLVILLISIPLFMWSKALKTEKIPEILPSPTDTFSQKPLLVKGSIPYWDQEKASDSFKQNISVFNYVNLFWYYLSPNGDVNKYEYANEDSSIIEFAHQNNVKVSAVITNLPEYSGATWDSKRVESVISEPETRKTHIANIVTKLNELGFDGIIIDYESVHASAKENFSNFIRELSAELHSHRKELAVVLHPRTGERVKGEENGWFQDWQMLAKYSDQLQIMAYNEHWDESDAGPIASAPWVKKIIEYAQEKNIDTEKLFLGIPLYGYDWDKTSTDKAVGLTFTDVKKLLAEFNAEEKWNDEFQSPYFAYTDNDGDEHEVWFENARSIAAKINLAKSYPLLGVTFWRLGNEDPDMWAILKEYR